MTEQNTNYTPDLLHGESLIEQGKAEQAQYKDPYAVDIVRGVANAPGNLLDSWSSLGNSLIGSPMGTEPGTMGDMFGRTKTLPGGFAQGATQFSLDMAMTSGAFKALGFAKGIQSLKFGKALLPMAEGAVADFTAFRGDNGRLSDLIAQYPSLNNPVTEFLKSKPGDSDIEGRMKASLEGLGLGPITNAVFKALGVQRLLTKVSEKVAKGGTKAVTSAEWEAIIKGSKELDPHIDEVLNAGAIPHDVSTATATAVVMRTAKVDRTTADGIMAAMNTFSTNKKMSLGQTLNDFVGLRRMDFGEYAKSEGLASALINNKDPTHTFRAAQLVMGEAPPRLVDGSLNMRAPYWDMLKERTRQWLSPYAGAGQAIAVKSKDDLLTLYKVLGMSDAEAAASLAKASDAAFGVDKGALDHVIQNGDLKITAQDLQHPTGYQNFGLGKRLLDAQEAIRTKIAGLNDQMNVGRGGELPTPAKDAYDTPAVKTEAKVSGEVADLKNMGDTLNKADPVRYTNSLAAGSPFNPINKLWQTMDEFPGVAKGVTDFFEDGKAIVTLFENADATTFIHELSHILRRHMPEGELRDLAGKLGVKEWNNWTRAEEEMFAQHLTDKILFGKSASNVINEAVGKNVRVLSRLYNNLRESGVGGKVNPSIKEAFEGKDAASAPILASDEKQLAEAGKLFDDAMAKNEPLDKALSASGVNLFHYDEDTDILKLFAAGSEFVTEHVPGLSKVQSREWVMGQARTIGQLAGASTEAMLNRMGEIAGKTKTLPQAAGEIRVLAATVINDFFDAAKAADTNGTVDSLHRLVKAKNQYIKAMTFLRETSANSSRMLGMFRADAKALTHTEMLDRIITQGGGSENIRNMAKDITNIAALSAEADRGSALRKLADTKSWMKMAMSVRIAAMLGPGAGFVADVVSNSFKLVEQPVSRMMAAGMGADVAGMREALGIFKAYGNHLFTSWNAFRQCLREGAPVLDRSRRYEYTQPVTSSMFNQQGTAMGAAIDKVGQTLGFFPNLRMASDEFFKSMNYRGFLESKYMREGMDAKLSGQGLLDYVHGKLLDSVDQTGRGVVPEAVAYAEKGTFSTPHVDDFTATVLQAFGKHPTLHLLNPFVKTPMNIFLDTVGKTPLIGALLKENRAAIAKGLWSEPARQVYAQQMLGGMALGAAAYAWYGGHITGRLSADPKVADTQKLAGVQPYSFVYTGADGKKKYISFARVEPWGSLLGVMADYMDLSHDPSAEEHKGALESFAYTLAPAVARNMLDKTFLRGVADLVNALHEPDKNLERYVASLSGSFVPNALTIFSQDPYVREAQGVLEGIKKKVPGWNETLMPKRNILGEPIKRPQGALLPQNISPFAYSESIDDPVKQELAALYKGFTNPAPVRFGVDYREDVGAKGQTAYDRFQELVGTTKMDGKTLSQTLNKMIGSKEYQNLVKGGDPLKPARIGAIMSALSAYRQKADADLMEERPALKQRIVAGLGQTSSDQFAALQRAQSGQ